MGDQERLADAKPKPSTAAGEKPKSDATADEGRSKPRPKSYAFKIHREETALAATFDPWERAAQLSVIGLFAFAALGCLYLSHAVIVPVLLALVVATILLPAVEKLEDWGLPRGVAVILVTVALIGIIVFLATILSIPMTYWLGRATELGVLIKEKLQTINQPLALLKELGGIVGQATGAESGGIKVDQSSTNIVGGILAVLTPAVSQTVLFLFAMIFYLIYQKQIRSSAVFLLTERQTRLLALRIIADIEQNMTVYFGTFTLVNICLGTVTVALAYLAGLPNPLLWGVLAAVLNYIPYIGVAIVVATLFLVGVFALPSILQALIAPVAYIGITTIEGQMLTPAILGHRLTLNPFTVFLSIAFWTWMWGPIGAFLAVPLLMAATVAVRHIFPHDKPDLPQ